MNDLPVIDLEETAKNITKLRKDNNLSIKDLQEIFNFTSPVPIYNWQAGRALPNIDNLVILASVFKVKIDDILVIKKSGRE